MTFDLFKDDLATIALRYIKTDTVPPTIQSLRLNQAISVNKPDVYMWCMYMLNTAYAQLLSATRARDETVTQTRTERAARDY